MNIRDIHLLYDYNYWANQLILTTAAELSPEQLTEPTGFSWGNLLDTLAHTMDSEHLWRHLCKTQRVVPRLTENQTFPTLDSVVTFWKQEETEMRAYLNSLQDSDMENIIRYEVEGNVIRERVLWHCLVHVVNHGTQHRSECAAMLTNFGHSPGGIDLTRYLNERPKQ